MYIKNKSLTLVCACFFFVALILGIYYAQSFGITENDITYYTATVSDVKIQGSAEDETVLIITNEHSNYWLITADTVDFVNTDTWVNDLNGKEISLGILNDEAESVNNSIFLVPASLKVDNNEIITLEDYNYLKSRSAIPAIVFCSVIAVACLVTVICNIIPPKKVRQ